jgi:hypothetical protein
MRKTEKAVAWVVYEVILRNKGAHGDEVRNAVCEQPEWDAMEQENPGRHTLIREGITSEGEAERLARGTSGDPKIRLPRRL